MALALNHYWWCQSHRLIIPEEVEQSVNEILEVYNIHYIHL